jgi:hypothetical protein
MHGEVSNELEMEAILDVNLVHTDDSKLACVSQHPKYHGLAPT